MPKWENLEKTFAGQCTENKSPAVVKGTNQNHHITDLNSMSGSWCCAVQHKVALQLVWHLSWPSNNTQSSTFTHIDAGCRAKVKLTSTCCTKIGCFPKHYMFKCFSTTVKGQELHFYFRGGSWAYIHLILAVTFLSAPAASSISWGPFQHCTSDGTSCPCSPLP